ncbi:MAG TPA: tetratricopeptide repeat protein, partial [Chitinophagaceae bacterium]|nr:tetratricopeptide repeat protein [Chitinophagaceae bacterium]
NIIMGIGMLFLYSTGSAQDAASLIKKGDEYFYTGKYDSAISFYTRAIKADPQSYEAYFSRAATLNQKKQYSTAIPDYTAAIQFTPPDSTEWLSGLYADRGIAYENKSSYDSALQDFEKALSIEPALLKVYRRRGNLFYNRNDFESALKDFSKAISLDGSDPELYKSRSKAYYCLNLVDSAIRDINHIITNDSTYTSYNYRGLFYTRLGQYDSALNDFLINIKNNYRFGNAYINIISPLVRLKRFQEASAFYNLFLDRQYLMKTINPSLNSFNSFLEINTYRFYYHYVKAVDLVSNGKIIEALSQLDTASLKYGTEIKSLTKRCYVDVLALRGYVLEKLERDDDAKACYEQALVIDDKQPDIENALQNIELKRVVAKTRNIDKTPPVIKGAFADTAKTVTQNALRDSITIKIRGTASDESGIRQVKVDGRVVTNVEEDGFFRYTLKKKTGNRSPIIISATDSSGNTATFNIHDEVTTRGGVVGKGEEETANPMGKFYAILIAEKDYIDPNLKDLNFPIRDANNLKKILIGKYTFDPKNVDTLYNRSREDILETIIARCKALGKRDNLLIFYAGHGDTTHDKDEHVDGYLVPTSAKKGLTSYFITSEEIKKALLRSNAQHVLLLLDACYSGSFTRGGPDDITGDLAVQWQSPSRKVMTSGNMEAVPDQSYFIKYLTEFLNNNSNPFLSAKDLWTYVDKGMRDIPKEEDRKKFYNPQYSAITGVDDKGGSFIFMLRKQN